MKTKKHLSNEQSEQAGKQAGKQTESKKSPEIESLLNSMSRDFFGLNRSEALALNKCVCCKQPLDLESLSKIDYDEYCISALGPCCFPPED